MNIIKKNKKNKTRKINSKISDENITNKKLLHFSKKFNSIDKNRILKNIITKSDYKKFTIRSDYIQNKKRIFKNYIDVDTKITNQKKSGTCWLFAFLNVIRLKMIKKYNLEDFEFSENFLFFYDKLEKANYFIEYVAKNNKIDLENIKNLNDMKMIHILDNPISDGGQWNMFVNLVNKYGIIPKTNMDDHFHSKNTKELKELYNNHLKKGAYRIIQANSDNIKTVKEEILYECYKILIMFLGEPPKKITWEYYEKKSKKKIFKKIEEVTPLEFYKKYVPFNVNNQICLINYPCNSKPYYQIYNSDIAFNVINGIKENYINLPINIIKDIVKKSIDNKDAVWCGIDTRKYVSKEEGFFDEKAFNLKDIFNFNNKMDKCDGLKYKLSFPNHAVVLRGYNFESKTNGFLVENSWGEDSGYKGNYYMSTEWFEKYVYEVVIDKKYVSKKILNVLKQKPLILPFWDPFGSLLF